MGFRTVFNYRPGKRDWVSMGRPVEGRHVGMPRIGDVARRDVPTCLRTDRAREVARRLRELDKDVCVVVNRDHVVLGLVRLERLVAAGEAVVESQMEPAPLTWRPAGAL